MNDGVNRCDLLGEISYTPKGKRLTDDEIPFHGDFGWEDRQHGASKVAVGVTIGYDEVDECANPRLIHVTGQVFYPSGGRSADRKEMLSDFFHFGNVGAVLTATASFAHVTIDEMKTLGDLYSTFKEIELSGQRFLVALRVTYSSGAAAKVTAVASVLATVDPQAAPRGNGVFPYIEYDGKELGVLWSLQGSEAAATVNAKASLPLTSRCCTNSKQ